MNKIRLIAAALGVTALESSDLKSKHVKDLKYLDMAAGIYHRNMLVCGGILINGINILTWARCFGGSTEDYQAVIFPNYKPVPKYFPLLSLNFDPKVLGSSPTLAIARIENHSKGETSITLGQDLDLNFAFNFIHWDRTDDGWGHAKAPINSVIKLISHSECRNQYRKDTLDEGDLCPRYERNGNRVCSLDPGSPVLDGDVLVAILNVVVWLQSP
ncbi:Kallikrein-6 [Entomophthora muscae]|uniref:Kallikrein-6 n=1 Tax=Entomophthora muscae TaxID=34485 RepID=A0ACC2RGK7_9FUNG|nr:Kallikrein-6 [Entomophthora muscae]